MRIPGTDEMTALDLRAQEEFSLSGLLLMEHAGLALLQAMQARYGDLTGQDVALLCGGGNNGGDGFALARLLQRAGAQPRVFLAADPSRVRGDAAINLAALRPLGLTPESDLGRLGSPHIVVDALLGTGARGAPRGSIKEAIERVQRLVAPVVAVDLPSGTPGEGGGPPGEHLCADLTVTMGLPKPFAVCPVARESVGELVVARIGFPPPLLRDLAFSRRFSAAGEVVAALPQEDARAHKGDHGRVLVIGGSPGLGGAALLAARGALRAGAGLVKVLGPPGGGSHAGTLPEAMVLARPEDPASLSRILGELASWADAVVLGPGLGVGSGQENEVWSRLLERFPGPVVLDADGLHLAEQGGRSREGYRVMTPHPGEAGRLLGRVVGPDLPAREEAVRELHGKFRGDVVLKGRFTLLQEDNLLLVNPTGSPVLATGGTGDVLAGVLGALLARRGKASPGGRVRLGIYLHGLAGNLVGGVGALAGEIADAIPRARDRLAEVASGLCPQGYPRILPEDGLRLG
jgi:NAD(P)H-hydrate epimerase